MENRRHYPRYESELEARIYTDDLDLSVMVVDISESGICIISEQPIRLEVEVNISLFPLSQVPVKGTPVWSSYIEKDQKNYYRIGVKTDTLTWS